MSPERFFIDPDHDEHAFASCILAGEIHYKTRDELSRMGVPWDVVKEQRAVYEADFETERRGNTRNSGSVQPLQMQSDVDSLSMRSTPAIRPTKTTTGPICIKNWVGESGDTFLIEPELVTRMPYATGTAFPLSGQFRGYPFADKIGRRAGRQDGIDAAINLQHPQLLLGPLWRRVGGGRRRRRARTPSLAAPFG